MDAQPFNDEDEGLSRFILHKRHIRSNRTIKSDAFIPHPHNELSVTRHQSLSDEQIWEAGAAVAFETGLTLFGRGDTKAREYLKHGLLLVPAVRPGNPNHVNVSSWPRDKPAQKIIAVEIAAESKFVEAP